MKILFVTDGDGMNYTRDSVMHGLMDSGIDVVDTCIMKGMYQLPATRRFTLYGKFTERDVDRTNIVERIRKHEFDYVFFGHIGRLDYFEEVVKEYDINHIAVFNGRDKVSPFDSYGKVMNRAHLFVRELERIPEGTMHPISYAVPEGCFCNFRPEKKRKTSLMIPGDKSTYVYDTEEQYYLQYQQSQFAFTAKKGGWDCLRHYEIISQRCLPVFIDIGDKPEGTMTNWPVEMQREVNDLFFNYVIDEEKYNGLLDRFFNYAKSHFTTKCLVKYIFDCLAGGAS